MSNENVRSRKYRVEEKGCLNKEQITKQFQDYCSCSSIHGVQYVGDFKRPIIERSWWFIVFILSFFLNGYLIYRVWTKWQQSPVIVSFSETSTPVWEVPFPAVTICLQVNSRKHQFLLSDSLKRDSPDELEKISTMSLLCDDDVMIENGSLYLDKSSIDFLIDVAPDIDDTMLDCKLRNLEKDCPDLFEPVFTEDGLCFTFNVLNQSEMFREKWSVHPYPSDMEKAKYWSLEKGYSKNAPMKTFPYRGFDAGLKGAFEIILKGNLSNQDPICRGPIPGYKILLHNPAEIPLSSEKYIRIPVEQEMLILVTPTIMTTSPSLRNYHWKTRQCFYPDERQLRFFNIYTERNCELECRTNYTLKRCGCASIYMPRDKNTPVCGGGMKQCTVDVAYEMRIDELKKTNAGIEEDYCNCLPACTSISYKTETSQAPYEWNSFFESLGIDQADISSDDTLSSITIFFTDTQFTTTHRSELYGIVDFLANCGGLLGLFSGISFLSFLEIMYFLTLRFWGNVKKSKRRLEIVSEEDENMLPT